MPRRTGSSSHSTLEPTESPGPHVEHVGLDIGRGAEALGILDANDIEYEFGYPSGEPAALGDESASDEGRTAPVVTR